MQSIVQNLKSGKSMTYMEVTTFLDASIQGSLSIEDQKQILIALNDKGYTGEEIAHFIRYFEYHMSSTLDMPGAIDVCGTGGSGLSRINTSTLMTFILSSLGVRVAKHGNKAASGRFGSFDLLESLDININCSADRLESLFKETGLAFIFARKFHPVLKHFAEVRKDIGTKTIFNLLGPLLNPAGTTRQVIGVSSKSDMSLIIEASKNLGKEHILVVCGENGLDEVTLTGKTHVMELKDNQVSSYTISPEDFGLKTISFEDISSNDAESNIKIAKSILEGKEESDHINLVLINAAFTLKHFGFTESYKSGFYHAKKVLEQGRAQDLFNKYSQLSNVPDVLKNIADNKLIEIEEQKKVVSTSQIQSTITKSNRSFKTALQGKKNTSLIAEIKFASPSNPNLYQGNKSPSEIGIIYENEGASAISVLTDQKFFNGSPDFLKEVKEATGNIPLLMKDFIIDSYQIYLARSVGANAILLIAALLDEKTIEFFLKITRELGMDALVEVHNKQELKKVLRTSVEIIGINNRNLHTFEVNPKNVLDLIPLIPSDKIIVAESGYTTENINLIKGQCDAVLIGTSLMKDDDIAGEVKKIIKPKQLLKICGITNKETAEFCNNKQIPLVGFNFVPTSKRFISVNKAKEIRPLLKNSLAVGVFQNHSIEDINNIAKDLDLDFVQLSGNELPAYCSQIETPIIKTLRIDEEIPADKLRSFDELVSFYIIDGASPGSGESYDYKKIESLKLNKPFFIAGGINYENIKEATDSNPNAIGVDIASGAELDGEKNMSLIESFSKFLSLNTPSHEL